MRLGRRKPLLLVSGFFMGITALFSVLFSNPAVIFVSIALFGFFGNLQNGAIYTIPMELPGITPRMGAVIFSFMLAGGNFGNFLGPLVVGYTADITGSFLPGFVICAVMSLSLFLAGVCFLRLVRQARSWRKPRWSGGLTSGYQDRNN
jgi:MFS family permease